MTFLSLLATAVAPIDNNIADSFWLPPQASSVAEPVDKIFYLIYWICVFFFVLIVVLMTWFVIKYRRRDVSQKAEKAPTHNTPIEVTWTVIPLLLVIGIFYMGLTTYAEMIEPPANAYEVYATGQKWAWTFDHRNGASETNLLRVPAGRPVKLIISSTDVLHAVFIPAFRLKQDAVPGRYTTLWFETEDSDEPVQYQLFCAEYCGEEHSRMTATVRVVPEEQFEKEILEAATGWKDLPVEELKYYAYEKLYARCVSCHTLDGSVKQGPSFWETHNNWGKERVLKDGSSVTVDENYVRNSILNPAGQIVEGFPNVMPTFQGQLKERQVLALVEMIKHLDEIVDEKGNELPR